MTNSNQTEIPSVRSYTWLIFAGFGLIFIAYGIYAFTLQYVQPEHWQWLTPSGLIADYMGGVFRILGMLSIGFGFLTVAISYGSFRRGDKWAWYAFIFYPILFLVAIPVTWLGLGCLPFLLISMGALWIVRPTSSKN